MHGLALLVFLNVVIGKLRPLSLDFLCLDTFELFLNKPCIVFKVIWEVRVLKLQRLMENFE